MKAVSFPGVIGLALLIAPLVRGQVLVEAPGVAEVKRHCTACHSALLVAQNHATRAGWERLIRWMQSGQGLWPLGEDETLILDYLAANYGPLEHQRRPALTDDLLPGRESADEAAAPQS